MIIYEWNWILNPHYWCHLEKLKTEIDTVQKIRVHISYRIKLNIRDLFKWLLLGVGVWCQFIFRYKLNYAYRSIYFSADIFYQNLNSIIKQKVSLSW